LGERAERKSVAVSQVVERVDAGKRRRQLVNVYWPHRWRLVRLVRLLRDRKTAS
jgi:hypothetical protein